MLRPDNPQGAHNVIRFNFKEEAFATESILDQTIRHVGTDSTKIIKDGDDAAAEAELLERVGMRTEETMTEGDGEEHGDDDPVLRNRFNFSERATQCFTYPLKEKAVETEAPKVIEVRGTVDQAVIYDAYIANEAAAPDPATAKAQATGKVADLTVLPAKPAERTEGGLGREALPSLSLLERMVAQNSLNQVISDYKYFNDPTDVQQGKKGSMLPLWTFKYPALERRAVTCTAWHPVHNDLFAVGYGTRDFLLSGPHPTSVVAVFSLSRPHHPEAIIVTPANVCSIGWNTMRPTIIVAGLYSGEIAVYDVAAATSTVDITVPTPPLARSSARTGKHLEPVWDTTWWEDQIGRGMDIYSTSSDGTAACWTVAQADVKRASQLVIKDRDAGMVISFNPKSDHHYLVGTASGAVLLCSKAYTTHCLRRFTGHSLPVSGLSWNRWIPDLFLSSAEDWSVILWDRNRDRPVARLDLDVPIHGVQWSPTSSTVFAVARADGKVAVYDFSKNHHQPLCVHSIGGSRATCLAFSETTPTLLVGDEAGTTHCLKLSPNLRAAEVFVPPKPKPGQPVTKVWTAEEILERSTELERAKLETFVKFAIKSNVAAGLE